MPYIPDLLRFMRSKWTVDRLSAGRKFSEELSGLVRSI